MLVGPDFEVSALQREKEDGFVAGITSRVVLGLDNADSRIPWLPDSLARYATGQRYRLRRLYTTNDEAAYSPRAMLMLSSRDPQFNRPDVAERLLPLYCERPGVYRAEAEIYSELAKRRSSIMAELLTTLATIADRVDSTASQAVPFRMADYASFGHRIYLPIGRGDDWIQLLKRLEKAQSEFASEDDGVIAALKVLIAKQAINETTVPDLFRKCKDIADREQFLFPKNVQAFGKNLTNLRRTIELELSVIFRDRHRHAGERIISLIPHD